jgi:hypothetical protein
MLPDELDATPPRESPDTPLGEGAAPLTDVARLGWANPMIAAALAGLLAWAGGEWVEKANEVPIVSEFTVAGSSQFARRAAAITTRATLAYGLLGAALAVALGLTGGLSRRSPRRAFAGAGAGLVLGTVAGAMAARVFVPFFLRNENTQAEDLFLPLLTHGGIWSLVGTAAGLCLGLGFDGAGTRALRSAMGGLAGAVVATLLYEVAGAVAFPLDQTGQPISAGAGSRLFACLVVSVAIAAVAVKAHRSPGQPTDRAGGQPSARSLGSEPRRVP